MFGRDWELLSRYLEKHPLSHTVSAELFQHYIHMGIDLGEAIARKALGHFVGMKAGEILEKEGITVKSSGAAKAGGIQVLAEYQEHSPIVWVYPERVQAVAAQLPVEHRDYFSGRIMDIALAHELYHYLWAEHYDIGNWVALIGFLDLSPSLFESISPKSVLNSPVTQEIAALQFSKTFLDLSRSPVLLCLGEAPAQD